MPYNVSAIPGVLIRPLSRHMDSRGWLVELIREDDLPNGVVPVMSYVSLTHPGIGRGPHEHRFQTDVFCFVFGDFSLRLWDGRPDHTPFEETHRVGSTNPVLVTVPPGVIHGYRNEGSEDALVLNFPDRLYAGRNKAEPVDEIRHEDAGSVYVL